MQMTLFIYIAFVRCRLHGTTSKQDYGTTYARNVQGTLLFAAYRCKCTASYGYWMHHNNIAGAGLLSSALNPLVANLQL